MGPHLGNNYTKITGTNPVEEKFIIVTDFGRCNTFLEDTSNTIKMIFEGNSVSDFNSTSLEFNIEGKRTFSLSVAKSNVSINEDIGITYTLNDVNGADIKYAGKKLSLIISAPNNIPADACLIANDVNYHLNSQNEFIIPLGDVTPGTSTKNIKLTSNTLPKEEISYLLDVQLWVSATANSSSPKMGEKLANSNITVTKTDNSTPSLKVEKITKRFIKTSELQDVNTIKINYIKLDNYNLTVELQHKVGNGYQKVTNRLNKVNGVTTHTMGAFSISANQGENNIEVVLSSATKILDESGNEVMQIPYNIMIIGD